MHRSLKSGLRLLGVCAVVGCSGESSDAFTSVGGQGGDPFADGGGVGGSAGASGDGGSSGEGGSSAEAGSAAGGSAGSGGAAGGAGDAADSGSGGASGATGVGGAPSDASAGGSAGVGGCSNPVTYYADTDKDGHGDPKTSLKSCSPVAGYVTSSDDCYDGNKSAIPNQIGWFGVERGDGSFDYDCDGAVTPRFPEVGRCQSLAICNVTQGWQESAAACGEEKAWITGCAIGFCVPPITERRTQQCH